MSTRFLLLSAFVFMLCSCSQSPEQMIIGTWHFEKIHVDQSIVSTYGQAYIDQLDSAMSDVEMIFGEDGSYRSYYTTQTSNIVWGNYTSNGDGTFTIHASNNGASEDGKVTRVNENELVVQSQGWAYLMTR